MALHGYEEVDHTADIAMRVWGEDFQALLRQAAVGLYALMGIVPQLDSFVDQRFVIPEWTPETILVDFLTELLYLAEEYGLVLDEFSFDNGQNELIIRAIGQKILVQEREIKAVTFHDLNVKNTLTGVTTIITFDV